MPQLETSTFLSQIFWLLTSFFSLWLMLSWLIIPKIESVLEERRKKIDGYIQKAEKINKQALLSLEKYEKALSKAQKEADVQLAKTKEDLVRSVEEKKSEIEQYLNQKMADNEYMLAKDRLETLSVINDVSVSLASEILAKLHIDDVSPEDLKSIAADKERFND